MKEAVVFQSFLAQLERALVDEKLTDKIAHRLYQNSGIISLEYAEQIKAKKHEEEKAQSLLATLHQLILQDSAEFDKIVLELESFEGLQQVAEEMKNKIWKNTPFILERLQGVSFKRNHRLGSELGLLPHQLDQIEVDHKGDSEQIRMKIIQQWLRNGENVTLDFLNKVISKLSHPICNQVTVPGVIIAISVLCLIMAISLAILPWNGDSFIFRNSTFMYKAIEHQTIPKISGSIKYIMELPQLKQVVVGRDEKVKDIVKEITSLNHSIMIVGKPGFGKSTLAVFAGNFLKEHEGLDVFIVDINEHFHDTSHMNDIKSFYSIISEWSKERSSRTVLILDNFDTLLIEEKKKFFQEGFLKIMLSHASKVSLIITTQIETVNENFRIIRAEEIDRSASLELLHRGHRDISDEQRNHIAEIVEDCPLALQLLVHVIDKYKSRKGIEDPVDKLIEQLNKSRNEERINEELEKNYVNYTNILQIAYDHLDPPAQCCGCCISQYPGSFSEKLFPLMKEAGIPCNDSFFENCVSKLVENSLLDVYTLEKVFRYKMHTLIKSFFRYTLPTKNCVDSYRYMFSLYFSTHCALPHLYSGKDLEQSSKILASDNHHFQRLLLYIKALGSESKYEAATLVIAYQRGEIKSTVDYQILYKAMCQCEECVDYIISSVGNEVFGRVVMNVSAILKDFNFARCELVTDNYCSKSLLYNPPSNISSMHSEYNFEVLKITCACYLMYYYQVIGTASILGTLPFVLLLRYRDNQVMRLDIATVVFIYLNFLPSVLKLYFGSRIEKIWLSLHTEGAGMYLLAQMLYELMILLFTGHMFQQSGVLYTASVRIKNILMLLVLMGVPMAILLADTMGIYTMDAAKWNSGAFVVLLLARYCFSDYVTRKISNGILLRLFFRLVLGILSLTSEFSCRFIINTSLKMGVIFFIGSISYTVLIAGSTAAVLSYFDML